MAPRNRNKDKKPTATAPVDDSPEALMERYSSVLTQLSERPHDRSLHSSHLALVRQLGDDDGVEQAREMLGSYYPLTQDEWTEWIDDRRAKLVQDDMEPHVALLDLYSKSARDIIYMPLLESYSKHVISQYYISQGVLLPSSLSNETNVDEQDEDEDEDEDAAMDDVGSARRVGDPNPLLEAVYGLVNVKEVRGEVLAAGGRFLSESQSLWNIWRAFELDLLSLASTPEERAQQLANVDALFLARLAVPHMQIEDTFAAYSTFVTRHDNDHYGEKLPAANRVFSAAKKVVDERDAEERKLVSLDLISSSMLPTRSLARFISRLQAQAKYSEKSFLAYLEWELEPKKPDYVQLRALFERALSHHPDSLEIWALYLDAFDKAPKASSNILAISERAVRALPQHAKLWVIYLRIAERFGLEVDQIFEKAYSTHLFDEDVEGLVALYQARAGFHRRQVDQLVAPGEEGDNIELIDLVVGVLREGISRVEEASKKGDPQLRLEKYLLRQLERFDRIEEAADLWESLTEDTPSSYAVWYGRADFLTRHNDIPTAHAVYVQGCSERSLDYPEYLIDAWEAFEIQNGNLADLEFSLTKIARQRKGLERKREREMKQYQEAQAAMASQDEMAAQFIELAVVAEGGKKRERSPVAVTEDDASRTSVAQSSADVAMPAPPPKKAKTESAALSTPAPASTSNENGAPTRDRENSTVFVTVPSTTSMTENDLVTLFKDCGKFRECKLKTLGTSDVAMIEFMSSSDVLAARTKDKKRLRGEEIQVEVAWHSCLYVTNFPEEWDKEQVEKLFGEYGTIFDTRWPSKRFKSTRRFCYVQYTNAVSRPSFSSYLELDSTHRLQALISDPNRKKGRTDADANNKELYIAGLSKYTKEHDLRRLFEPHGTIKGIRVNEDDQGECRGFAFVEYEDEASAQAALILNNTELKKRHISVTIAQARARGAQSAIDSNSSFKNRENKTALSDKSVRVTNIAPGTEEAIVQQAFEKLATVKLVTMSVGATHANVELDSAAEAGKVLLAAASEEGIVIDGTKVHVVADGPQLRGAAATSVGAQSKPRTDAPLLPRQAGRGRGRIGLGVRGRGSARGGLGMRSGPASSSASISAGASVGSSSASVGASKTQDDFRALLNKGKK
ncbi:BZ3500_MvSof-1268-A1-R1_Chr3-1g06168 [Microbotryum saponariae]|uniref:BZ3500_MvSof-1268-A1-R1_Chr3-1g06168 protein n=1 Tax=Microbotryum saponariae TaxID=289078 RepID=A0A2X0NFX5_9BASI|nr:BZ3500_MvSof-1268-A1-R1_Chr3-1g06168 [Microbotryum saponariae]SDA04037.1 BZ3501_MvSof-1269-A2-R1_Chr3-2g05853 [Microbotryum saponariae]